MSNTSNLDDSVTIGIQYSIMREAISRSQYAVQMLSKHLFSVDDPDNTNWIDDVAYDTGLNAAHLRDIFLSGIPMTLQDYLILSDYAEIDPVNDPEANKLM